MNFVKLLLVLFFCNISFFLFAQKGKNGIGNITTANTVVNEYYAVTNKLNSGVTTINVNTTGSLQAGDLILIIEVQGALLQPGPIYSNGYSDAPNKNINIGSIVKYNSVGLYEFKEVVSVSSGTITVSCPLINAYDYNYKFNSDCDLNEGINMSCTKSSTAKVQVVKVPRYTSLTVSAAGSITTNAWDGTIGGIVAIECQGNTTINGSISASAKGFRGGDPMNSGTWDNIYNYWITKQECGGMKGEGIGGWVTEYDGYGGRYGRGVGANGGGGGDAHNAAGGGGANAGDTSKWIDGSGVPDPLYNTCWALETPSIVGISRSGGGRGGYGWATATIDPTTNAPDNGNWGGNGRKNVGGFGGRPLDYTSGRIFMGGGGGAGHGDQNLVTAGGKGGGIIIILNYVYVKGTGSIVSDGQPGGDMVCPNGNTIDVGSGAGAGGAILIHSSWGVSGITLSAKGGRGGNQPACPNASVKTETEGGAGGGGGGFIAISSSIIVPNVSGGKNGVTSVSAMSKFPPNGGTSGGNGISSVTIINEDSICPGGQASLSISNIVGDPKNSNICWYQNKTSGIPLTFGLNYSPLLSDTTTFWVGLCSSCSQIEWPRIPVKVHMKKNCGFTVSLTATPDSICKNNSSSITLSTNGGSGNYTYQWDQGLPATAGPQSVTPLSTTIYHITATDQTTLLTATDSVVVYVETPSLTSFTSVCVTDASFTLSGGSPTGGTYKVDGVAATTFDPKTSGAGTHNITYISPAGCNATQNIDVKSAPTAHIDGTTTVCPGSTTTLTASGGGTYLWSENNATTAQITVSPVGTPTYSVTVKTNGCTASATHVVNVSGALTPTILTTDSKTSVCAGDSLQLTATGGATYQWASGEQTDVINTHALLTPKIYTVSVYGSDVACSGTASVTISVNPLPVAVITGTGVCSGKDAVLTASGADAGGHYQWDDGTIVTPKIVKPLINTTYYVTAYNASGCSDSTHYIVIVSSNPIPVITSKKQRICSGTSTVLKASGGTTYSWSNQIVIDSIVVNPSASTQFTVTVTNAANCTATDTLTIRVIPPPDNPLVDDADRCSNDPLADVTLTIPNPKPGYVYRWYSALIAGTLQKQGPNYTEPQVNAAHTYYIETISPDSCHSNNRQQVNINWNQPPTASFYYEPAGVVIQGAPIHMINQSVNAVKYVWSFGRDEGNSEQKEPYKIYSDTGLFTIVLTALSSANCKAKDSMEIYVKRRLTLWLPKVFTPNNDGRNDLFYVRGPVKTMNLEVYNQWGFLVFKSEKQTDGWDGKYKGVEQPEGNYVWILESTTTDEQTSNIRGVILLIR